MIYIILATCVNLIMVFTFKIAHVKKWNPKHIILINYFLAFSTSFILVYKKNLLPFFLEIFKIDSQTLFIIPCIPHTIFFAVVIGTVIGMCYVGNILLIDLSVLINGSGLTTLFTRSGFLLSITASAFLFHEKLSAFRILGIFMTLSALIIVTGENSLNIKVKNSLILFMMICFAGSIEILNKVFSFFALIGYINCLTFIIFSVALLLYTFLYIKLYHKPNVPDTWQWQEIIAGIFMGLPNSFGNIFQILALERLPTSIVYPSIASGTLFISIILSHYMFRENLSIYKLIAIILTLISLIIINI